jgi:hypothetical protein
MAPTDVTKTVPTEVAAMAPLLQRDARAVRTWWWGWLGGFSALTVGQGALYLTSDDEDFKAGQLVGAAGSTLGVLGTLIHAVQPYDVPADGDLHALLADRAAREIEGRGWVNHTLNAAVNVASGAVLWGYYKQPGSAAFTFVAGMLIGEAQIWTQPTLARDARAGDGVTTLSVVPGGLLVRRSF